MRLDYSCFECWACSTEKSPSPGRFFILFLPFFKDSCGYRCPDPLIILPFYKPKTTDNYPFFPCLGHSSIFTYSCLSIYSWHNYLALFFTYKSIWFPFKPFYYLPIREYCSETSQLIFLIEIPRKINFWKKILSRDLLLLKL